MAKNQLVPWYDDKKLLSESSRHQKLKLSLKKKKKSKKVILFIFLFPSPFVINFWIKFEPKAVFVLVSNHFRKCFSINAGVWLRIKNKFSGKYFQLTVKY